MHKFTIFTILLSVIVVFVVAELVVNDYMGDDFVAEEVTEEVVDPEMRGDEEEVGEEAPDEEETPEEVSVEEISVEEVIVEEEPSFEALLTDEVLTSTTITEPVLTTAFYDGLVFGFWDTSEEFTELVVLKHKLFDGATYMGSIFEIQPGSAIDLFTAYETLRSVSEASDTGEINENNAYGDASFYFNHATKTNMVFLVVRLSDVIYSLEYSPTYHGQMRSLIEVL
jgi:hypothetical protein